MVSLNLGAAELGESLTGDKGYMVRGTQREEEGSCPTAMVTPGESSLALTGPGHLSHPGLGQSSALTAKPRRVKGAEPHQVSHSFLQQTGFTVSLLFLKEPRRNNICSACLGGNRHRDEMSPSGHPSMKVGLCPQPGLVEPSPVPGVCGEGEVCGSLTHSDSAGSSVVRCVVPEVSAGQRARAASRF